MLKRIIPAISFLLIAGAGAQQTAEDFATVKAAQIERLQKELTCVQAATSFEAMRECRPHPPAGHMGPPPRDGAPPSSQQ